MRITQKDLDQKVEQLNGFFETESFSVGGAYGGWMLHRTLPSGGRIDVSPRGTKKETWWFIEAMIKGIDEKYYSLWYEETKENKE